MGLKEKEIAARVAKGEIRCIITFEIVGRPKEHIEQALKTYLANLRKDARLTFLNENVAEAMEQDEGFFSTFAEVEMLVKGMGTITWIAVNFSPASIEILEPASHEFPAADLTAWFNDLIAKLHEIGLEYRNTQQKNKALNASLNALINNFVLSVCEESALTTEQMQARIGIHKDQLTPFVEHLVQQGRLEKIGTGYRAVKGATPKKTGMQVKIPKVKPGKGERK